MSNIYKYLLLFQPILGSFLVNLFMNKFPKKWYSNLTQSPLTPPGYIFGPVWTILYILLGLNAYRIYQKSNDFLNSYFPIYEAQLLLNFSWSFAFFHFQKPKISLLINFLMIILTIFLLFQSWKIDKKAFYYLIPYFIWISFAAYLNFYIVIKN